MFSISSRPACLKASTILTSAPMLSLKDSFSSKEKMLEDIVVAFGGRVAEELVFGDVTTGASQDIRQATETARAMVTRYGMSETLGAINYEENSDEVFIGRDLGHMKGFSEETAREIDLEVKRIIQEAYARAKSIISSHEKALHECAAVLQEKEKIGREEFEEIFARAEAQPAGEF